MVEDYTSSILFYEDNTIGDNISSSAKLLDTANGGTSDWFLSPYKDENKIDCTEYYCKATCTVYRDLITLDKLNDVQYT